ncbi:MAG TPA: AarF/UbiB family protein [Terriglobales bacterium]|nr:AarF/UbiB family protein [Terriglobales bacterium]
MPSAANIELPQPTSVLQSVMPAFMTAGSTAERIGIIEAALEGPQGQQFRDEMAGWVLQFLPIEKLVPQLYEHWRPLVQEAMRFMLSRLSTPRLAPKLVEQVELPFDTAPEVRLLKLIVKVPGLQKLGQVLARNRHLPQPLRRALIKLENGINDVTEHQVRDAIQRQLGPKLERYTVELEPRIFCEASVSAVVRFTWWNPAIKARERGVFKVLKPYIPSCFAEDMHLLADLAKHLGARHRDYGFAPHVLPDTFNDVRRLLQHEVDFGREQATLARASKLYAKIAGVRIPRVIPRLCTSRITAMTEERGRKITDAVRGMPPWQRARVAEQLVDAVIAIPLFAPAGDVLFHADPHAGNLFYHQKKNELIILDWALTEKLTIAERRHLALLFLMIFLRDPVGACNAIEKLSPRTSRRRRSKSRIIHEAVDRFLSGLPAKRIPGAVDAMDLLEEIAWAGVRLPSSLVMFRKALFTLDGILHDIGAPEFSMESVMARHIYQSWMRSWKSIGAPLSFSDWVAVQCSALLFPGRLSLQAAQNFVEQSRRKAEARHMENKSAAKSSHGVAQSA